MVGGVALLLLIPLKNPNLTPMPSDKAAYLNLFIKETHLQNEMERIKMNMETGLFDHMVVQRNRKNVSEAKFSGTCSSNGIVVVTVRKGGKVMKGFSGIKVGIASKSSMNGCINGLPAGGPYEIELKVGEENLIVKDLLVGDVWLLGGQSNMYGCGLFPEKRLPSDPLSRAFYMDDRWAVAKDPVHNMWECVDQVHIDLCGGNRPVKPAPDWGVCPGPAFANRMRQITSVPQGIIACAQGGTTMTHWDPARKGEGGKSLYGALVRRLKKNGGRVAGMIWYQGCSDANDNDVKLYTKRMRKLVSSLRKDCGDNSLPVAIVQIARVICWENTVSWNSIQEQQRLLPKTIPNLSTAPAIDLPLDDGIHISGAGQYNLGKRLAYAMDVLIRGRKAGLPPIALKKAGVETVRGLGVAVVEFENVAGRLRSGDRPSGFSIVTENGAANHFAISLDGTKVRIRSNLSTDILKSAVLHYGYGIDPYCNITDEAGRSLPVLGPIRLGLPHAITPFIREFKVSSFQPSAGNLHSLKYPSNLEALKMENRSFTENFCNLHPEIATQGGRDKVAYYSCKFSCPEKMGLELILGYDGPVKAWIDGKQVFHDANGINPATPSKGKSGFTANAGVHELLIALGTNNGAAWGIFARLERIDLNKSLLIKGKDHYAMPVIHR
jgi:sialate O-acetylesterase